MQFLVSPLANHAANMPGARVNRSRVYALTCANSGLVMTQTPDGKVVQKKWTESDHQRWRIIDVSDGSFRLESVATGKALGLPDYYDYGYHYNNKNNDVPLAVGNVKMSPVQLWWFLRQGPNIYQLQNNAFEKVMGVDGESKDENAALIQTHRKQGDLSQSWLLSEVRPKILFNQTATVYHDRNYGGARQDIGLGKYDTKDLTIGDDRISSLKVPEGLRVTLFEQKNFRGNKKVLIENTPYVGSDFDDKTSAILVEKVATFFEDGNYGGKQLSLGIGRYNLEDLAEIGNDRISSIKVPQGLQVTLYEHVNFKGNYLTFDEDVSTLREYRFRDPNEVYRQTQQQKNSPYYGYHARYDNPYSDNYSEYKWGSSFENKASSVVVKAVGIAIPKHPLNFGDTVGLRVAEEFWLSTEDYSNTLTALPEDMREEFAERGIDQFTIVRAGDTKHSRLVAYGDVVALLNKAHNKYVSVEGQRAVANKETVGDTEKFILIRAGETQSKDFVGKNDVIALRSFHSEGFLRLGGSDVEVSNRDLDELAHWKIAQTIQNYVAGESGDRSDFGTAIGSPEEDLPGVDLSSMMGQSVCGAEACTTDICHTAACGAAAGWLAVCGADACGAAACAVEASLISACGVAASGLAICAADFAIASICGAAACGGALVGADACAAAACGGALGGLGACGADVCAMAACGAAACGAAACGAAACGAAACAGDACSMDADLVEACVIAGCNTEAGGIDACPVDFCGANVCALNLCPIDACVADACAIDIIPIVPGI